MLPVLSPLSKLTLPSVLLFDFIARHDHLDYIPYWKAFCCSIMIDRLLHEHLLAHKRQLATQVVARLHLVAAIRRS